MADKIRIGGEEYAALFSGNISDRTWDGRDTVTVTLVMTHAAAVNLFVDDTEWFLLEDYVDPETNEPVHDEHDMSEYRLAGDITDHRDGTISVKMGKLTDLEELLIDLYGGEEE